jgi:hypothetical protein
MTHTPTHVLRVFAPSDQKPTLVFDEQRVELFGPLSDDAVVQHVIAAGEQSRVLHKRAKERGYAESRNITDQQRTQKSTKQKLKEPERAEFPLNGASIYLLHRSVQTP